MLNRLLAVITMSFFLSACGGGGSDDKSPPITPPEPTEDTTPPTITLLGDTVIYVALGDDYSELGATAVDDIDGQLEVLISGTVDTGQLGRYQITYYAEDKSANGTTVIRTVEVVDSIAPTITLLGDAIMYIEFGNAYTEPGASALDDMGDDVVVSISGSVDTNKLGSYQITYYAEDSSGNSTTVTRTVNIVDRVAPVIALQGDNPLYVALGADYVEPGAIATDNVDELVSVTVTGDVDTQKVGTYSLIYKAIDASGNESTTSRDVIVKDSDAPVITIVGGSSVTIYKGDLYVDQGASAVDNVDGDLTSELETSILVDTATVGTYTVKYHVYDAAGNYAEASREVIVAEKSYAISLRDRDLTLYENEYTHRFWFDFDAEQNTSRQLMFRVSDLSTAENRFDFELKNTRNEPNEQSGYIELSIFDDAQYEGQEQIIIEVLNEDFEVVKHLDIILDDTTTQPIEHATLAAGFRFPSTAVIDDTMYVTDGRRVLKYDLATEQNVGYSPNQDGTYVSFGDGVVYHGEVYFFSEGLLFQLDKGSLSLNAISSSPSFVEWTSELQVVGNKLYVIGGYNNGKPVNSNYSYDFESGLWATQAPSLTARYGSATAVVGDNIYVFGGNYSGDEYSGYSTLHDSWLMHGTNYDLGFEENTAVASGNHVYISESRRDSYQLVMRYNVETMTWASRSFGIKSHRNLDSFMYKGRIYLVGGDDGIGFDGTDQVGSIYWGDD